MKKILISLFLLVGLLQSNVAYDGIRTFTNPDGTTFQGKVKGLAEVHWIETVNGDIVQYNFDKKAYYEINFDQNGNVVYVREYLKETPKQIQGLQKTTKTLTTEEKKKNLIKLLQKKNSENYNNINILKEKKLKKKKVF